MTLEMDFIRIHMLLSPIDIRCRDLDFDWPPPERIYMGQDGEIREARPGDDEECIFVCTNRSALSDEAADHPNLMRGAEYHYASIVEGVE